MTVPSAEAQLVFLKRLQRLFDEGGFVATYKFALLLSLAELAVEVGDDSGEALPLSLHLIADRFLELYWPASRPYVRGSAAGLLVQSTGQQATVVRSLVSMRDSGVHTLAQLRAHQGWPQLVRRTVGVLRNMPLWRLQMVGGRVEPFLYAHDKHAGGVIVLEPGVAYCLRAFFPLVEHLVQGAWVRFVRERTANAPLVGDGADLEAFLFGEDRVSLARAVAPLTEAQAGRCFYCDRAIGGNAHVDHFLAHARYPLDLAENLVLAHASCNGAKRDHMAARMHLERWLVRLNGMPHDGLAAALAETGLASDPARAHTVADWLYGRAADSCLMLWRHGRSFEPATHDLSVLIQRTRPTG